MLNDPSWNIMVTIVEIINDFTKNEIKDLLFVRTKINKQITSLFNKYGYNQDFVKLIIFYIDEQMYRALGDNYNQWQLLQLEFFAINNGGQVFFDILEHNFNTYSQEKLFTLKIGYFLLKLGFLGKFYDSEVNLIFYMNKIENLLIPK